MTRRLEILGLLATAAAVVGVYLNNHKLTVCFWFWLLSNGLTAYLHVRQRMWTLAVRDLIFLALAIQGMVLWSNH